MRLKMTALTAVTVMFILFLIPSRAADTIPAQIPDEEYWKMISDFSEPGGSFQLEIITSNEVSYQSVMPQLVKTVQPGGVYLGVAPEQNFTYIAGIQPKIAFIFDIRRDMMLEHLMYKSLFEWSEDRADFVSHLFSRRRPASLTANSSVEDIFDAFSRVNGDPKLALENAKGIMVRLKIAHKFNVSDEDEKRIVAIFETFLHEGVVNFNSSFRSPGYAGLMTMSDYNGKNWSFLASSENYNRVRAMQQKNLIVPIVGDFAGPKALRAVGQYLKQHGAVVSAFYISNVEDYIGGVWPNYMANIAALPLDNSSTFIRWSPGSSTTLASMGSFVRR
ncbi:MAG TPA: hypothetical protein VK210_12775 [Terriglobia bacterium]|nr:hypothetical protein [Terriglobia bacterium]